MWLSISDCKVLGDFLQHWWLYHYPSILPHVKENTWIIVYSFLSLSLHFSEAHRPWSFYWLISPEGLGLKRHKQLTLKQASLFRLYSHKCLYHEEGGPMVPQAMETPRQGEPEALAPASTCTRKGASASQRLQDHTTHLLLLLLLIFNIFIGV